MPEKTPERRELLSNIEDIYDPARHRVLLVADTNHYQTGEIADLTGDVAEALRHKGISAVGFELSSSYDQKLFDSLANKEITREDFLSYLQNSKIEQLSLEETQAFHKRVADLIQGGLRVYGLSIANYAPDKPEIEATHNAYQEKALEMDLGFMKFRRQEAAALQRDPKSVYARMINHIHQQPEGFSTKQSAQIARLEKGLASELRRNPSEATATYREAVHALFIMSHPEYDAAQELGEKLGEYPKPDKSSQAFYAARLGADRVLASGIKGILERETGLVVQYGFGHTVHALGISHLPGSPDLDGALRKAGVGVMIVDPYFGGAGKIDCTPLTPPEACGIMPKIGQYTLQAGLDSGDPDRHVIPDIQGSEITKIKDVKPTP